MSLLKLPLLASVTWGINLTMTPPTSPPEKRERLKSEGLKVFTLWFPILGKSLFWIAASCESAVILSTAFPKAPFATPVLRALVPAGADPTAVTITAPFLLGCGLSLAGALLRRNCYRVLDDLFTFEISIHENHRLVTTGPYAFVRHPSYTGAILCVFGTLMVYLGRGSWLVECTDLVPRSWKVYLALWGILILLGSATVVSRMRKEDALLKQEFGKEWEVWAQRVPCWLFPGLY